jgi:predicted O-methyltransferase YrrM
MNPELGLLAENARGFMPTDEGLALYEAARTVGSGGLVVEVGSYCGKSGVYLGAGAAEVGATVFTIDHHRGSEEMQLGWEHHDHELTDIDGRMDSLPFLRRTIAQAGLEETVVCLVGHAEVIGKFWTTPAAMVFIDGGHGPIPAHQDYELWAPHVQTGGLLAIHDVFPNPDDGGRPPHEIFCRAIESGEFTEVSATGSLRILRRVGL